MFQRSYSINAHSSFCREVCKLTFILEKFAEIETFVYDRHMWGHYVHESIWNAIMEDHLTCSRESSKSEDLYVSAVLCEGTIVGHISKLILAACILL